jgi:3'(2'), 5'-bisphosphate nucleotidase
VQHSNLIAPLINISIKAGDILMKHFKTGVTTEIKGDNSPVTKADIEADKYISEELSKLTNIPIISEEGKNIVSKTIKHYFLVDPLDGTKSFIKGDEEFTVNIGLIENNRPTMGFIYKPVTEELFYTKNGCSFYKKGTEAEIEIRCNGKPRDNKYLVIASKSHLDEQTRNYVEKLEVKEFVRAASSLKFCKLAMGEADIYPRFGPTMQWDTAAGHAILEQAGGSVIKTDGEEFLYILTEDKECLLNGYFLARGWREGFC